VKIGIVGTDVLTQGKANLVDARIKQLREMFNSAKEVYIQVEIVTDEGKIFECDGIICPADKKLDLVVADMEFVTLRTLKKSCLSNSRSSWIKKAWSAMFR
jgi:hypothetical protein